MDATYTPARVTPEAVRDVISRLQRTLVDVNQARDAPGFLLPSTGPTAEATSALPGTGSGPGDTPPSVRSEAGSSGAQLSSHDTSLTFNVGTSVDGTTSGPPAAPKLEGIASEASINFACPASSQQQSLSLAVSSPADSDSQTSATSAPAPGQDAAQSQQQGPANNTAPLIDLATPADKQPLLGSGEAPCTDPLIDLNTPADEQHQAGAHAAEPALLIDMHAPAVPAGTQSSAGARRQLFSPSPDSTEAAAAGDTAAAADTGAAALKAPLKALDFAFPGMQHEVLVASVLLAAPAAAPASPRGCKITSAALHSPRAAGLAAGTADIIPAYRPGTDANAATQPQANHSAAAGQGPMTAATMPAWDAKQLGLTAPVPDAGSGTPPYGLQLLPRTLSTASDVSNHSMDPRQTGAAIPLESFAPPAELRPIAESPQGAALREGNISSPHALPADHPLTSPQHAEQHAEHPHSMPAAAEDHREMGINFLIPPIAAQGNSTAQQNADAQVGPGLKPGLATSNGAPLSPNRRPSLAAALPLLQVPPSPRVSHSPTHTPTPRLDATARAAGTATAGIAGIQAGTQAQVQQVQHAQLIQLHQQPNAHPLHAVTAAGHAKLPSHQQQGSTGRHATAEHDAWPSTAGPPVAGPSATRGQLDELDAMMAALESDIKCLSPGRKQRPIARQSRDIDDVMPGLPSPGPKHSLSAWPASPRALTSSPKPGLLQSPGSRRVSTSSNLPFPEEPSASSLSISSSALIQRSSSSYRTIQTVRQCQEEILAMEPVPRFMQDTDSSAQRVSRSSASFKRRSLGRSQSSISRDVSVTSEYHSVRSTASSVSAPQPSASQEQQQAASLPTTPTGSGKPRGGLGALLDESPESRPTYSLLSPSSALSPRSRSKLPQPATRKSGDVPSYPLSAFTLGPEAGVQHINQSVVVGAAQHVLGSRPHERSPLGALHRQGSLRQERDGAEAKEAAPPSAAGQQDAKQAQQGRSEADKAANGTPLSKALQSYRPRAGHSPAQEKEPWVCQRVPGSAKSPWTAPDRNAPSPPPKQPRYIAHAGDAGYAGPAAHSPQRPAALPGMRKVPGRVARVSAEQLPRSFAPNGFGVKAAAAEKSPGRAPAKPSEAVLAAREALRKQQAAQAALKAAELAAQAARRAQQRQRANIRAPAPAKAPGAAAARRSSVKPRAPAAKPVSTSLEELQRHGFRVLKGAPERDSWPTWMKQDGWVPGTPRSPQQGPTSPFHGHSHQQLAQEGLPENNSHGPRHNAGLPPSHMRPHGAATQQHADAPADAEQQRITEQQRIIELQEQLLGGRQSAQSQQQQQARGAGGQPKKASHKAHAAGGSRAPWSPARRADPPGFASPKGSPGGAGSPRTSVAVHSPRDGNMGPSRMAQAQAHPALRPAQAPLTVKVSSPRHAARADMPSALRQGGASPHQRHVSVGSPRLTKELLEEQAVAHRPKGPRSIASHKLHLRKKTFYGSEDDGIASTSTAPEDARSHRSHPRERQELRPEQAAVLPDRGCSPVSDTDGDAPMPHAENQQAQRGQHAPPLPSVAEECASKDELGGANGSERAPSGLLEAAVAGSHGQAAPLAKPSDQAQPGAAAAAASAPNADVQAGQPQAAAAPQKPSSPDASAASANGLPPPQQAAVQWRNSPQWVRIACRLSPALPPHFLFLTEPTTLQAALGTHVADSRLFSYDQVLVPGTTQQQVGAEAAGLVDCVLDGHNCAVIALGRDGTGKTYTVSGTHIAHDDRPGPQPVGLMTQLVSSLFHSTATRSTTATTVHVTAFEIQEESLTDLLQARPATSRPAGGRRPSAEEWAPRSRLAGSARSPPVKHEVFIDREGRTWVSNLTAVPVADAAAFEALRETISRRRHSARGEPSHHGDATFVLTLMVTAELPVPGAPQRANGGASPPRPASASLRTSGDRRTCSKLTFVEVGGSSSGPLPASSTTVGRLKAIGLKHALSPAAPAAPSAAFGGPKAAAAGKRGGGVNLQDNVMWAVSEVIWAAARGRNIPVPYRLCKLTRYLQDTLTPSGKALVLLCVNPAEEARAASLSTLALGARMMPSTGAILRM